MIVPFYDSGFSRYLSRGQRLYGRPLYYFLYAAGVGLFQLWRVSVHKYTASSVQPGCILKTATAIPS